MTSLQPPRNSRTAQERAAAAFRILIGATSLGLTVALSACLAGAPASGSFALGRPLQVAARAYAPAEAAAIVDPVPEDPESDESVRASLLADDASTSMEEYEQALAEQPQSDSTRVLHARLLALAGKLDDARDELALVLAEAPQDTNALYALSRIDDLQGRTEERLLLLRQIVKENPAHADALADLGELAMSRGATREAQGYFQRALFADPSNLVALLCTGSILVKQRAYQASLVHYDRAAVAGPGQPLTYIDRASVRQAIGDTRGAVEDLSRAISLDPQSVEPYLLRGKLYLSLSRPQDAMSDFTLAIRIAPDRIEGYALRAALADELAQPGAALADWESVVSLRPGYQAAFLPLGMDAWKTGDWPAAREAFLRAYQAYPQEPALLLLSALCDLRQGDDREARKLLSEALSKVPRSSWYHDAARFLLGQTGEAQLLARIGDTQDSALRARMLFYIGVDYLATGRERAGSTYLARIGASGSPRDVETRLASFELERLSASRQTALVP